MLKIKFISQAYHVTDAALGYFSPKQSHSLSILRLQSCWELTNHGIVNIGKFILIILHYYLINVTAVFQQTYISSWKFSCDLK